MPQRSVELRDGDLLRRAARRLRHCDARPNVGEQRVFAGCAADVQIALVRLRESRRPEPFVDAPAVVLDHREERVGRFLVKEQRERFAAPRQAAVEFGIGLCKRAGLEVGASEVEVSDPRVEQPLASSSTLIAQFGLPPFNAISP